MSIDQAIAAQVHREIYVAMINSALCSPGDKQALARRLGVTPQYLSNLLNPGFGTEAYTRTPGPKLAERLVEILPLEQHVRSRLLQHMDTAWKYEREAKGARFQRASVERPRLLMGPTLDDLATDIALLYKAVNGECDPMMCRSGYRLLYRACSIVLRRMGSRLQLTLQESHKCEYSTDSHEAKRRALLYVEISLMLAEVQRVLNRPDDALLCIKYARELMERIDPGETTSNKSCFGYLLIGAIVSECHAYRNLGLYKHAHKLSVEAEETARALGIHEAMHWIPDIYMARLKIIVFWRRFSLSEVGELVRSISLSLECRPTPPEIDWAIRLSEAEAMAYLQYGTRLSIGRAIGILGKAMRQMESMPGLGILRKVQLLSVYASAQWREKALDEWRCTIEQLLAITMAAGLDYEYAQLCRSYGPTLIPILHEIGHSFGPPDEGQACLAAQLDCRGQWSHAPKSSEFE